MSIIEAENLCKWYGTISGLNQVSFEIKEGVWGVVGPNGAGKTTLLNLISGLIKPSLGTVKVNGESSWRNYKLGRILGYCPDLYNLWEKFTGYEFIWHQALIKNKKIRKEDIERLLEQFDIMKDADRKISSYSKGMRQKLKFIAAIVHQPEIILFDEPLNGVDPGIRAQMIKKIRELGEEGKTVIVSSHILHEVELMTPNVIILYSGTIIAKGNIYKLRELLEEVPQTIIIRCSDPKNLAKISIEYPEVKAIEFASNDTLRIRADIKKGLLRELPLKAIENGIKIYSLLTPDYSLDSLYKYLISK